MRECECGWFSCHPKLLAYPENGPDLSGAWNKLLLWGRPTWPVSSIHSSSILHELFDMCPGILPGLICSIPLMSSHRPKNFRVTPYTSVRLLQSSLHLNIVPCHVSLRIRTSTQNRMMNDFCSVYSLSIYNISILAYLDCLGEIEKLCCIVSCKSVCTNSLC